MRRSRHATRSWKCSPPRLTVAAIVRFGLTPAGIAASVLLWTLIALTFIDFDTQLLPDNLTLPLLWAGLLANVYGAIPDGHACATQ